MNCHQVVKTDSHELDPIRNSWETGKALEWVRIHKLPDYVYFDHSVHVTAGVGCKECHGRIDQMERVRMVQPLSMGWCIECHRDVRKNQGDSERIRPVAQMTNMQWKHDGHVDPPRQLNPPENCMGCHR
jgi:hypothetical protein